MSTELYIPPQGLFFRLLGYESQHVLVSRNYDIEVFQHRKDEEYDDQYFQLIAGTGEHRGSYLNKSKVTGKVLFSRKSQEPRVWHVDGDGKYDDNWFCFEKGTGKHTNYFRLRNNFLDYVLVSRKSREPQVYNHPASEVCDDQYFTFLFEDTEILRVEYHLDIGKIVSSNPKVIAQQTLRNDTEIEQEMTFEIDEKQTHTSTFEYTSGFTVSVGTSVSVGVPEVAGTEVRVDQQNHREFKWGSTDSFEKSCKASLPVKAPKHCSVRAISTVNSGNIDVPFTMHLKSKATGFVVTTEGLYKGVTTWDLRHSVERVPV